MARRDGKTIYMDKYSEWCWNPLIGFGFVPCREGSDEFELVCRHIGIGDGDAARAFFAGFPRLPEGKYTGIVVSPLGLCALEPDLILIYCNPAQLRSLVWGCEECHGQARQHTAGRHRFLRLRLRAAAARLTNTA